MSKEYRIPKNIKPQDLVRGIVNASFWHWGTIDETQHAEAIKYLSNLESIDNAKPSEALKKLEMLSDCAVAMKEAPSSNWIEYANSEAELDYKLWRAYEDLKQYILKAQENEKVLEIIKEKDVDIALLKLSTTWLDYYTRVKHKTGYDTELTEEEFKLLKEWLG